VEIGLTDEQKQKGSNTPISKTLYNRIEKGVFITCILERLSLGAQGLLGWTSKKYAACHRTIEGSQNDPAPSYDQRQQVSV
jgi:hypothetical protein